MQRAANIKGSNNISMYRNLVTKIPSCAILEPYLQLLQKYNKRFLKEYSDELVHLRTQCVKILLDKVAHSWLAVAT